MMTFVAVVTMLASQDSAGTEFFESRIRPLLAERCLKCHGETKVKGGLRLDSKAGWEKGGDSGPAIVPRKPGSSPLVKMIRSEPGHLPQMPPDRPLAEAQVADLVRWIEQGAPDPRTGSVSAAKAIDWKAAAEFWSFRPVDAPASASIDQLVHAALAERKLRPVRRADPWTLIRRVSFDLTGLPPTEQEVRAFVEDRSPDAFAKVVDRLLASPAYGEHQARKWLDLVRYAEDQIRTVEKTAAQAWRYRDWVIESFNRDLPYDRFVRLQLAADLMEGPEDDPADRRALGLLGLGNVFVRPNNDARAKAEEWDDRVDTLTRTFLGLTVSCARCHDHKFDPIPTQDYYSLTGIIAATKDTPLWAAPRTQIADYESAASRAAAIAQQASDFLQSETDRQALAKTEGLVEAALAVWADPTVNKELDSYLRKGGGRPKAVEEWSKHLPPKEGPREPSPKVREMAESLCKSVRDNLAKPVKQRNADLMKGLFGEKGVFPLPEKIVVEAASPQWRTQYEPLRDAAKAATASLPAEPARCYGVADIEKPVDLKVFIRGNPERQGEPAPRRFLRVLSGPDAVRVAKGSGRLDLADAIADPRNPLTARVMANRIWQQHFGRGIVSTPSNFGALGSRPSHPALLDLLADRFVRGGWSVKKLHREILLSDAWQRDSTSVAASEAVDPENQWLWRGTRRRLTAEELRDAVLSVSGGLDRTAGGPSPEVDDVKNLRRTVYAKVSRLELGKLLRLFDFPDPHLSSERRTDTTLPQQSLFLLNSPFMIERAKALAAAAEEKVQRIYELALGRAPSADEAAAAAAYLAGEDAAEWKSKVGLSRAERLAHAILVSNAFLYID
jgi:hypothetical protein